MVVLRRVNSRELCGQKEAGKLFFLVSALIFHRFHQPQCNGDLDQFG